jgi:hypothetical protein
VTLPAGCVCQYTPYDFPVGNPYPYLRVQTGVDGNNPGHINVTLDTAEVIQCGASVTPAPDDQGVCGDPWINVPADASQVNPNILRMMDSLRPDIEQQTGVPVKSFTYWYAQPPK